MMTIANLTIANPTIANPTIANLTNAPALTLDDVIADAASTGATEGTASNAKHEFALRVARAALHGAVSSDKTKPDAERVVAAYLEGKKGNTHAPGAADFKEAVFKKSVSQFRAIIKCGAHVCGAGVEVLEEALDIASSLRREPDFKRSLFQSIVDVSVAQNKQDTRMTPDEIVAVLNPPKDAPEYDLAERVEALLNTCKNLINGTTSKDGEIIKPAASTIDAITSQRLESALSCIEQALASAADKPNHQPAK